MRTSYYPKWKKVYSESKKADVWYPEEIRFYDEVEKANSDAGADQGGRPARAAREPVHEGVAREQDAGEARLVRRSRGIARRVDRYRLGAGGAGDRPSEQDIFGGTAPKPAAPPAAEKPAAPAPDKPPPAEPGAPGQPPPPRPICRRPRRGRISRGPASRPPPTPRTAKPHATRRCSARPASRSTCPTTRRPRTRCRSAARSTCARRARRSRGRPAVRPAAVGAVGALAAGRLPRCAAEPAGAGLRARAHELRSDRARSTAAR